MCSNLTHTYTTLHPNNIITTITMPKRQKEKQYQSAREHRANQSIRSGSSALSTVTRPLPFDCCALTLCYIFFHKVCHSTLTPPLLVRRLAVER